MRASTCYMCEELETSREHVPAQCFFPEMKDLPPGIDLRRNLFTVPSCDAHNTQKSQEDQYLWQIITATQGLNECGQLMVRTKGVRTMLRRPALVNSLMRTALQAYVFNFAKHAWRPTAMVRFTPNRIFTALEHFARALYFWHFKTRWYGVAAVFPSFAKFSDKTSTDPEFRHTWRDIILKSAAAMAGLPRIGDNQDAFYYQVMPPDGTQSVTMLATFYGSARVTCGFLANDGGPPADLLS